MGAVCKICGKDMMNATECTIPKLHANGRVFERIKVGAPGNFDEGQPETIRCHDCNALFGHLHHWDCDAERCPACGGRLIICGCEDVFIEG